jgi:hypothetical protein
MNRANMLTAQLLVPAMFTAIGALGIHTALADDAAPANTEGPNGRHHNPAWAACRKQADDQKLEPGDRRKEFMKNCIQSAKKAAPATS